MSAEPTVSNNALRIDEARVQALIDWSAMALASRIAGPLETRVIKASDTSAVVEATVGRELYYFKASNEASRFEAALSSFLSSRWADRTVGVAAADEAENFMILQPLPGQCLRSLPDPGRYGLALSDYCGLQRETMAFADPMLALGVPDRRMRVLKREIDRHLEALCSTGLDEEKTRLVMDLKGELLAMCDELDGSLPDALEHGDLHSANIFVDGKRSVFFDWGDASVSHPFMSVRVFWNSLFELNEPDTDEAWFVRIEQFRPGYLSAWRDFGTHATLKRLLALAEELACAYRALSWHLYITPFRVNKADSYGKPAQWLNLLLDHRKRFGPPS